MCGDKVASASLDLDCTPHPTTANNGKRTLIPSPLPISSPHFSSPLPSIPSLPPPASVTTSSQVHLMSAEPAWEHIITNTQLRSLLNPSASPLYALFGSLSLLLHFVHHSAQEKTLQSAVSVLSSLFCVQYAFYLYHSAAVCVCEPWLILLPYRLTLSHSFSE